MALRDIQSRVQKAKVERDKQLAASTTATQAGSTSTPTPTEAPKVVQPAKTQDVVQQRTQSNISNIKNIRSAETSNIPDLFDKQSEEPYQSHLSKWFGREPGEKTQGAVTNLFDKLRPGSEKAVNVWETFKTFGKIIKEEGKEETKGFDKWYTPEGLKQYFNYGLDELSPLVRPMVGNAGYTSLDTVKGITNWINNTIDSIDSRIPDEGLLVRKGILESSKTQEEIEADKERKKTNREAIAASILDTVNAGEQWLDNTEIGKEVKSVEGKSLIEAVEQGDTEAARRIIGNNIGYMLPSIGAGVVGGDVGVAASIFPVTYQDTLEDYMSDESILENSTPEEIHWMATVSSALQTAIEIISLETQVLKPLRNSTTSKELSRKITQPVVSRVIGQWLKGSLAEGVEEISQQFIQEKFAQLLGSNREQLTVDDYANIGLEAFIMGLIITGPGAVIEGVSTNRQKIIYNQNLRKIKEAIPGITEEEAEEILNTIIDYEEKKEDITKLENKATKLYNNKQNIQTRIDELQQNPTDQNKYQIQLLEKKIQDIDESISKVDKKINDMYQPMQDVNERLNKDIPTQEDIEQTVKTSYENMRQSELDRLKAGLIPGQAQPTQQKAIYKESGGENLSQQTMSDRGEVVRNFQKKELDTFNDVRGFINWANKLYKMNGDEANEELSKYTDSSLRKLNNIMYNMLQGGGTQNFTVDMAQNIIDKIKNAEQFIESLRAEKEEQERTDREAREKRINKEDYPTFEEFRKDVTHIGDINNKTDEEIDRIKRFGKIRKNGTIRISGKPIWDNSRIMHEYVLRYIDNETSEHLVGLSNADIRDIKNKLTPEQIEEVTKTLALVSTTLGIDFNLVLDGKNFGLSIAEKGIPGDTSARGQMLRDNEISDKLLDTAIVLTIKEGYIQAASTLAHEMGHIMDVSWAFDNLESPTYRDGLYSNFHSLLESKATGELMPKWETYMDAIKKKSMGLRLDSYLNKPTEVFARYTQQYIAFINDREGLFKDMANGKDGGRYWTENEFLKLLDDYYDILDNQLGKYRMSEGNAYYYDVMLKLDEYKKNGTLASDAKWIEDIRERFKNKEFGDELVNKMFEMQSQYVELSEQFDRLEGNISNEMREAYATLLDSIKQNMDMLAQLGQEYNNFVSKKISEEGVEASDEATESNARELKKDKQEVEEENGQFEVDEELQEETDVEQVEEEIEDEGEKEKVNTFKEDYNAFREEQRRQKKGEYKQNSIEARRDVFTVAKNILTPTMTRIYNINKRIAGRLTQMETQTGINIYRHTQKTQGFVDTFNNLSKEQQLEVSMALFNFGALAKEQTDETIQEYKDNEKKKLRDVLKKNGFKDEDVDGLFEVLNDLGTRYQEAGMKISISDMYFPRTVRDYKGLIRYLNEHSENTIAEKGRTTIYGTIQGIVNDPTMSDEDKDTAIRRELLKNFTPRKSEKSKYSEERQLGLLSDWGAGIYAYYENPVESLASYITSMEQAIQRQLFLGGMKQTLGIETDTMSQTNEESVTEIIRDMFEKGQITENQMSELHTCLMSVLNKKGTPRWVKMIKNITYTMALTNYISAMNQAEDIGVAIIENKRGLISVLKSIFTKAGIKYDEAGLESAYEMFKTNSGVSDWLFKKSGFNAIDRMGKRSFLNAAWNSMVQTYKNPKARGHMYERLKAMYGDETANHIMECVRTNNFMNDGEIDIDVLTDLLYQLGNTQPIYQSSMPVSYLEHPGVRWLYSLSMFSLRQIDHIIQSTKSAYEEGGVANAAYVGFKLITARMFFNALIGGVTSLLQGDLDDSWIWKLFEGDWEGAGKLFGGDMLKGFLKMWMFSKYDWKVRKNEGLWAFATNRISPYILQEGFKGRKAVEKALKNDDRKELMVMLRDVPLLGKQAYGRWEWYQDNATGSPFDKAFDSTFNEAFDNAFDEAFDNAFDNAFNDSFNKSFDKAFK